MINEIENNLKEMEYAKFDKFKLGEEVTIYQYTYYVEENLINIVELTYEVFSHDISIIKTLNNGEIKESVRCDVSFTRPFSNILLLSEIGEAKGYVLYSFEKNEDALKEITRNINALKLNAIEEINDKIDTLKKQVDVLSNQINTVEVRD